MEEEQSVLASEEQRRICKELAEHYRAIISLLGDDPDREITQDSRTYGESDDAINERIPSIGAGNYIIGSI